MILFIRLIIILGLYIWITTPIYSQHSKKIGWSLVMGYSQNQILQKDNFKGYVGLEGVSNFIETQFKVKAKWRMGFLLKNQFNNSWALASGVYFDRIENQSTLYAKLEAHEPQNVILHERWENSTNKLLLTRIPVILEKNFGNARFNYQIEGGLSLNLLPLKEENNHAILKAYYITRQGYDANCDCRKINYLEPINPTQVDEIPHDSYRYFRYNLGILLGVGLSYNLNSKTRFKVNYQLHQDVFPSQELWYRTENETRQTDFRHLIHTISLAYEFLPTAIKNNGIEKSTNSTNGLLIGPGINYYFTKENSYVKTSGLALGFDLAYYLPAGLGIHLRYSHLTVFTYYKDKGFSVDLGVSYRFQKKPLFLRGGLSFINTSNSDGGTVESSGYHLGAGILIPVNKWLVFRADLSPKIWFDRHVDYSIETGIGLVVQIFRKKYNTK